MASSPRQQRTDDLRRQLADLSAEILRTEDELASLEGDGRLVLGESPAPPKTAQTPAEKIALFLDLFGTRRSVYLDRLQEAFSTKETNVICHRLDGQMGKKARHEVLRQIDAHYAGGTPFVLFATASLIGEGFDLPRLDTLVLSMPLSWKGRLVQYAVRIGCFSDRWKPTY